jgi:predicted dehydrogenase
MNDLKLAVVGVGALGRHHARILSQMHVVDLVAVADPNESQGRSVAESCGCEWTHDYRTLLQRVDAASIVVPTSIHRSVASEFLRRSIPVLVEKPLAGTVEDGAALVELAAEHRIPLQVGHIERFNPAFQQLAELAGSPRYIRAERLSPYAFRSMDIGAVHDLMIHDIDLALRLTGSRVEHVSAFGICIVGGQEDCVQARLTFENGCVADLVANRVCPTASRRLQVWSETGCVDADLHQRRVTAFQPGDTLLAGELPFDLALQPDADIALLKEQIFGRFIQTIEPHVSDADALTAELASFAAAVRTNRTPVVDGRQGLAALDVAERIVTAVREHCWDGAAGSRIGPHAHQIHAAREAA